MHRKKKKTKLGPLHVEMDPSQLLLCTLAKIRRQPLAGSPATQWGQSGIVGESKRSHRAKAWICTNESYGAEGSTGPPADPGPPHTQHQQKPWGAITGSAGHSDATLNMIYLPVSKLSRRNCSGTSTFPVDLSFLSDSCNAHSFLYLFQKYSFALLYIFKEFHVFSFDSSMLL